MALIAGVNIPDNKRLSIALRSIYGVGDSRATQVAEIAGIQGNPKVHELNDEEVARVRAAVERGGYLIEGPPRPRVPMNIPRLVDIRTYRAPPNRPGPHVRGQRTQTNARTKRGSRRAIAHKKRISK